jgi:peptidoglycan/xylan/chitin deacetylase (PgdA/CDA1 family)
MANGFLIAAAATLVALTFDDLPAAGALAMARAEQHNRQILDALKAYDAPATGFVIGQRGRELGAAPFERILKAWVRSGHDLGNHTHSHADLNTLSVAQFEEEVTRGETAFRRVLPRSRRQEKPLYFRFPYNHSGDSHEKLAAVNAVLTRRGYQVATCTIDNSDYEFSRAYDLMLARGAESDAARLRQSYLDFTGAEIDYYSGLHRKLFQQEVPHVMLLHLNRLNADVIGGVLDLFRKRGFRFVTLEEAQSHPAYRTPITQPSRYGPMWGYRWARELGAKFDGRLEPQPPAWVLQYGK